MTVKTANSSGATIAAGTATAGTESGGAVAGSMTSALTAAANAADADVYMQFGYTAADGTTGQTLEVKVTNGTTNGGTTAAEQLNHIVGQLNADSSFSKLFTASTDGTNLIITNAEAGATDVAQITDIKAVTAAGGTTATAAATGGAFAAAAAGATAADAGSTPADGRAGVTGDYNVSTTVISNKGDAEDSRLASTYFGITADMVEQGASIQIGNETYYFQTEKNNEPSTADVPAGQKAVTVDVSDLDTTAADYLSKVAERITDAAGNNKVYTVGHDNSANGRITITENVSHANLYKNNKQLFDLTTKEGIQESLGYTGVTTYGKGLTLQIGDTSDAYNRLTVAVQDMHVDALGIGDVDISTQEGAQAAIDKIKTAINSVSSTRGDLGALQNRLDHTANNLAITEENITQAESNIRDTDIAEEMMAYTKNNILVQSGADSSQAAHHSLPRCRESSLAPLLLIFLRKRFASLRRIRGNGLKSTYHNRAKGPGLTTRSLFFQKRTGVHVVKKQVALP